MSKQNKWAGNMGKVAAGGSSTSGGNGSGSVAKVAAPRATVGAAKNKVVCKTGPGENNGNTSSSSHNSINTFTRGIKSRGPYTGPSFASMNNSKKFMQETNSSLRSLPTNPSGPNSKFNMGQDNASVSAPRQKGSGPQGGPSFRSMSNSHRIMQGNNPSTFNLPSGSSMRRGSTDGSGTGMTKSPVKTGSGKSNGVRQSSPVSNKDGSGYQASVR
jgi:hypothetical protein